MEWVIAFQFCTTIMANAPQKCEWQQSPHPIFRLKADCENFKQMIDPSNKAKCELKQESL